MKKISYTELKAIIYKHAKWARGEDGGERADLRGADLHDADLFNADLFNADLSNADLSNAKLFNANLSNAKLFNANLSNANLSNANLCGANLRNANLFNANLFNADLSNAKLFNANLSNANLSNANLCGANLSNANLSNANLFNADLRNANLSNANLCGANLRGAKNVDKVKWNMYTTFYQLQCPETGSFIGYKKASGYIIELEICADAKRSSATSRKCRCSKAKVLGITNLDGSVSGLREIGSNYNKNFIYHIGETVEVPNFDDNRWNECAPGIHFFITREEAVKYKM